MKRKIRVWVVILALCSIGLYALVYYSLYPTAVELAMARTTDHYVQIVNQAVRRTVEQQGDGLITFQKDESGGIAAFQADTALLNTLSTEVSAQILALSGDNQEIRVAIPLGAALGYVPLMERGPEINVTAMAASVLSCRFESSFQQQGINQTEHKLICVGQIQYSLILWGRSRSFTVPYEVVAADTVIVGQVPDSYTYFSGVDTAQEAAENYLNFN